MRKLLGACLVVLLLVACGESKSGLHLSGGGQGGASGQAGAGGSAGMPSAGGGAGAVGGAGPAAFEPLCFDAASTATCEALFPQEGAAPSLLLLASASELGQGARFEELGGWAALARFDDDRPPQLVLTDLSSTVTVFDIDTNSDTGPLDIVAVWGAGEGKLSGDLAAVVAALGCNEAGCQLLAAARGASALEVIEGYELPASRRAEGLVSDGERLCVYGRGLFCLGDAGWNVILAGELTAKVAAVTLGSPAVVALGGGSLLVEDPDTGAWSSWETSVRSPLSIDAYGRTLSVLADDGTWVVLSTDPQASMTCVPNPPLLLTLPGPSPFGVPWLVVDEQGNVFRQRQTYTAPREPDPFLTWCRAATGPSGTIRDVSALPCGDGTNLLAVTDEGLYSLFDRLVCPVR